MKWTQKQLTEDNTPEFLQELVEYIRERNFKQKHE